MKNKVPVGGRFRNKCLTKQLILAKPALTPNGIFQDLSEAIAPCNDDLTITIVNDYNSEKYFAYFSYA